VSAGLRHEVLIAEDDPTNAEALSDIVRSMNMNCRVVTTLDEMRACLEQGYAPCAVLQDMQMPHTAGARPHEKVGESGIALVRGMWPGKGRVAIVVVTAFRFDPDFVWQMAELEADAFVQKQNSQSLPDKLLRALKKNGRESHASCAQCSAESRAAETLPRSPARLFSHEHVRGAPIDAEDVQRILARRAEYDLFLDYASDGRKGYLAGHRDHRRVFREALITETSAAILAELVESRRPTRADAIGRLKKGGQESAVRLVQQARKAVDVRVMVGGKESRTEWRSIHTVGGKGAMGFVFEPRPGVTYAVMVKG
jgi:DNA-binding NarL/FixJ family response regulator